MRFQHNEQGTEAVLRTTKRASKAAAMAFVTATMSFGGAAHAQDANRPAATEAEVSTSTYVLSENDSFSLLSMPTEAGRILFMQIAEDVSNTQAVHVVASLADGDYSGESQEEFAVVHLEGNIGEYGRPVLETVGRLVNISRYNVAVAYQRGSQGEPRASVVFSEGRPPSAADLPIASERDLALLSMNVRTMAPSRDNPGIVPAASIEQSNEG